VLGTLGSLLCGGGLLSAAPNLIVTTDIGGDPDDQQSMRRLMLYSNEFNILGLIASASGVPGQLDDAIVQPQLITDIINDYGLVRANLTAYSSAYPTTAYLHGITKSGNPNRGLSYIGASHDTDGSNHIISQVDAATGKVNIAIWGGATDVAQAFYRVRANRTDAQEDAFVEKCIVYSIADQDSTGAVSTADYLRTNFPKLKIMIAGPVGMGGFTSLFRGMYQNDSSGTGVTVRQLVDPSYVGLNNTAWLTSNVTSGHGALGANYPDDVIQNVQTNDNTTGVKEGDTPSWFYFLPNGLSDPEQPAWGGWGGRFNLISNKYYTDGQDNHWSSINDTPLKRKWTVARWRVAYQNDFRARMDRCLAGGGANRNPLAVLNGNSTKEVLQLNATAGTTLNLSAAGSSDPNAGQTATLEHLWWIYQEPGTYTGTLAITGATTQNASIAIPADAAGTSFHVILEVTDQGTPKLTSYRRAVVNVSATGGAATLAAHWLLNETSGTSAADASGNGNTGTLNNGPVWTTGIDAGALQFDGTNDYVQVANSTSLNLVKNFTIAAWVGPTAVTSGYQCIVGKVTGANDKQYQLGINAAGALQFDYEKSNNNYALSGGTITTGTWQHVAVTIDSSRNVKLYINGLLATTGTAPADVSSTTNPVTLGRAGGTYNSNYLGGGLDDVRIYNGVLSGAEVEALAGAASPAFQESGGQVLFEAEDYHASNPRTDPNGLPWTESAAIGGFTGGGYVTTALPGGTNTNGAWADAAELSYQIDFVTAGTYNVWVRRYAQGGADNSGWGGVGGTALSGYDNLASGYNAWTWVKLGSVAITPGQRTFQLRRREANYRVDRVLLTTSASTPSTLGITMGEQSGGEDAGRWASLERFTEDSADPATGWEQDLDKNGVANGVEFSQFAENVQAARRDGHLVMSFYRSKLEDLHTCRPWVSSDLVHWYTGPAYIEETITAEDSKRQLVEARDLTPTGDGPRFMRLEAVRL
jgi:hypothetical protein